MFNSFKDLRFSIEKVDFKFDFHQLLILYKLGHAEKMIRNFFYHFFEDLKTLAFSIELILEERNYIEFAASKFKFYLSF
jgi:hypothetical protein